MINALPQSKAASLWESYATCRNASVSICRKLTDEDIQAQSMPDASPLKWHLAHTTWAIETFILKKYLSGYAPFDASYEYLFNSYYNAIGAQYPRPQRGLLTRPDRATIMVYRQHVDCAMQSLIDKELSSVNSENQTLYQLVLLVINHEQQHQELMLTDLKHLFSFNPNYPKYANLEQFRPGSSSKMVEFEAGLFQIGHQDEVFYFDNEGPRHQFYSGRFALASNLVSNSEYIAFIEDGGYQKPEHWLSEAWQKISSAKIQQPFYWRKKHDGWYEYTLDGLKPLIMNEPVKHVSYFEASAFASWKKLRLPTEQEWEIAVRSKHSELEQVFDQLWQWTSSSYSAYPGFKPAEGAIGEYNGKFMVNQYVLRGGSIATPQGHIRPSYRNFFYPDACWQFTGIRLAETL